MPRFLAAAVITTLAQGLAPSFKTTISSNSNDWKKGVDEALYRAKAAGRDRVIWEG